MKRTLKQFKTTALACAVATALHTAPISADERELDARWSGVWDQPDQESQGFMLQISEDEAGFPFGVVYWFTYDDELEPHWVLGVGPVVSNALELTLYKSSGVGFLTPAGTGDSSVAEIGEMTITFDDCDDGLVTFNTIDELIGSGTLPIERLTDIGGLACDDDDDDSDDDEDLDLDDDDDSDDDDSGDDMDDSDDDDSDDDDDASDDDDDSDDEDGDASDDDDDSDDEDDDGDDSDDDDDDSDEDTGGGSGG